MPVYEYECGKCGKHFEELQKVSDKPLKRCKFCGGVVQRLISRTSFSLKGGGWYKDGYSSTKAPESGKAKTKEAPAKPKPAAKASS